MKRLAVLGSTNGSSLQPIIDAIQQNLLNARIEVVISNKENSRILGRAARHGISNKFIVSNQKIIAELCKYNLDIIVLIGWMRILPNEFLVKWPNKIINVHPSLLPKFAGLMNEDVHRAVLEAKNQESGCTVHLVTDVVDGGKILIQKKCPVLANDNIQSLKSRVQALESDALITTIIEKF